LLPHFTKGFFNKSKGEKFMKKIHWTPLLVVLLLLGTVSIALAAGANFRTHLTGADEVPARETQAQGQATFRLNNDGTELYYKLIASNIDNIFMAHIHYAPAGVNGQIIVWLYPAAPPAVPIPGRHDGELAEGVITGMNILEVGPFAGLSPQARLDLLVHEMESGAAYVNVHTNDFVNPPNTGPGDFPGGEIRGQIDGHDH
jgi:hypothetical protein